MEDSCELRGEARGMVHHPLRLLRDCAPDEIRDLKPRFEGIWGQEVAFHRDSLRASFGLEVLEGCLKLTVSLSL
jgi:hypothetical protein